MEVSELSGVVGSVIYEASVLVGLPEDEKLVGWLGVVEGGISRI